MQPRIIAVLAILAGTLAAILTVDPIAQDPAYHRFADTRAWLGIPNFADVASNAAFLVVGVVGLTGARTWVADAARRSWYVMFLGVALVSIGSGYYHLQPDNRTLLWDRLPMTVAFMGLFVALLTEHLDARMERFALAPAMLVGAATVAYWHFADDLRPYLWVQLAPLLSIPVVLALGRRPHTHAWLLLIGLACYVGAKATEHWDAEIFRATGEIMSGHTAKHLLSALAVVCIHVMLIRRRPRETGEPGRPEGMA